MRKFSLVLVMILIATAAHATDPVTRVRVHHTTAAGFSTTVVTSGTQILYGVTNGYPIVFEREAADPPWSAQVYSENDHLVLDVHAGTRTNGGGTVTCCEFDCHWTNQGLSVTSLQCWNPFGGCEICELVCTTGWTSCPAGSIQDKDVELQYTN
jgi:hypothetical protein